MKAIETHYKGYRFRSRLEARWAVFLDAIGARWEYEPEGYELASGWYLPDFFVHFRDDDFDRQRYPGAGYWLEIKPIEPSEREKQLMVELVRATRHKGRIYYGVPGDATDYFYVGQQCHRTSWSEFASKATQMCVSATFGRCAALSDGFFLTNEQGAINAARGARFEARP